MQSHLTGGERKYRLSERADREKIVADIIAMAPNGTLTFILSEHPDQGSFGKVGFTAGRGRDGNGKTPVTLDLVETDDGLTLYATTSEFDEDEE